MVNKKIASCRIGHRMRLIERKLKLQYYGFLSRYSVRLTMIYRIILTSLNFFPPFSNTNNTLTSTKAPTILAHRFCPHICKIWRFIYQRCLPNYTRIMTTTTNSSFSSFQNRIRLHFPLVLRTHSPSALFLALSLCAPFLLREVTRPRAT